MKGCVIGPRESPYERWLCVVLGPRESPYEEWCHGV